MPSITRIIIGLIINIEMWFMLFLNLIVLTCIIRGRLYNNKENPVYLISAFNLAGQTCQLLLHVFYVGPAIISGSWIFQDQNSVGVTIIATCFLGLWYLASLIQIMMATNRITPDPTVFSYSYLVFPNQTTNPSMYYVDLPLDISTSVICIISYVMVGIEAPEAYTVTTMVFMLDCGINSIIYITMNKEIRREINKQVGGRLFTASTGLLSNIIKTNSINPHSQLTA
uniref:7TM_GPCR_Srx domain-containing protein n=1 Tax=Heterorhabditis bacteriophora TaxID=37862 RepID=A0A1I7XUR9_HETBA